MCALCTINTRVKEPFDYSNREDFQVKLVEWIGDVLYDILPEHGYEVRDEQIFTAFQIADAVCSKKSSLSGSRTWNRQNICLFIISNSLC